MLLSSSLDHAVTRIVKGRYIIFTCPHRSKIELYFPIEKELQQCPICRAVKPIKMNSHQQAALELAILDMDVTDICIPKSPQRHRLEDDIVYTR